MIPFSRYMIMVRMHSSILNPSPRMKQNNIYPECNVDTNLVRFIIGGHAKHKSSCNAVVKAVNNTDEFAIGIIDDDKRRATMDGGFVEYKQPYDVVANIHIKMFIHNDRKRFIFTVKPAMDKLIYDAASAMSVNLTEFDLGSSFEDFKKVTKSIQAGSDPRLRKLFPIISDYPEIQRFRNTLRYLMFKQYGADVSVVKGFFDGRFSSLDLQGFFEN